MSCQFGKWGSDDIWSSSRAQNDNPTPINSVTDAHVAATVDFSYYKYDFLSGCYKPLQVFNMFHVISKFRSKNLFSRIFFWKEYRSKVVFSNIFLNFVNILLKLILISSFLESWTSSAFPFLSNIKKVLKRSFLQERHDIHSSSTSDYKNLDLFEGGCRNMKQLKKLYHPMMMIPHWVRFVSFNVYYTILCANFY